MESNHVFLLPHLGFPRLSLNNPFMGALMRRPGRLQAGRARCGPAAAAALADPMGAADDIPYCTA